jgi:hypothetical protein
MKREPSPSPLDAQHVYIFEGRNDLAELGGSQLLEQSAGRVEIFVVGRPNRLNASRLEQVE